MHSVCPSAREFSERLKSRASNKSGGSKGKDVESMSPSGSRRQLFFGDSQSSGQLNVTYLK